ncbi:MAG: multicopper oxidase domain-containing protein [Glaciimonas sp.]|nr:multicopper oxidase domain-containing protein [Glaciimonas sp.]
MLIRPIDYFLVAWFALAALSTAYVAYDQFKNNPEPLVMKWGFVLITLYMGPLGLLMYVMADKEPSEGAHEEFIKPLWKQGIGSTIHCVAGDATGIIFAATITALLGLPMWLDVIIEYLAGFLFGLLIFQSLFMKSMMGGSYFENVRKSFMPEFISMNTMMAGMAPIMILLMMGRDMRAMDPTELVFWGVMSLGVAIGFFVAYPVNLWMVAKKMKHGLMTERGGGSRMAPADKNAPENAVRSAVQARENAKLLPQGAPMTMDHAAMQEDSKTTESMDHAAMKDGNGDAKEGGHGDMRSDVTTPQLATVALITFLMLAAGMVLPSLSVNMSLSVRDVGGSIIPPGMIMTYDTPGAAMRDMAAVKPRDIAYTAPPDAKGDALLQPRIENGVKIFDLETSVIRWSILPGVQVDAYTFNQQIPGPRIRVTEGDRVRINVKNRLPESTTVHWHGLILPNEMDGPAQITQAPIQPGGTFTYEFTTEQSGTYFYHSHDHIDRQQGLGLYGALIIDPKEKTKEPVADTEYTIQLQEWLQREGLTYPSMPMEGGMPNYFTINGKAYPATDTVKLKVGQTIKLRFIGSNSNFIHPMHVHGGPFTVVARDGEVLAEQARFKADTVNVGPGQRYDVIWKALRPGKWLVHCHIAHHTTNNNTEEKGGGGLMMILDVAP